MSKIRIIKSKNCGIDKSKIVAEDEEGCWVEIEGEILTKHFAITDHAALGITEGETDFSLTHLPTGRRLCFGTRDFLRKVAEDLEQIPLPWDTKCCTDFLLEQYKPLIEKVREILWRDTGE